MKEIDLNTLPLNDDVSSSYEELEMDMDRRRSNCCDEREKEIGCDGEEMGVRGMRVVGNHRKESVETKCRQKCPFEKLLEGRKGNEIGEDEVVGLKFLPVEEMELFYRKYATYVGFDVRRDDRTFDTDGVIRYRWWVCCRAGRRRNRGRSSTLGKKKRRAITRVMCPAELRVKLCKTSRKYIVSKFNPNHNHVLVSPEQVHLLRGNRKVTASALATAIAFHRVGVTNRQIMDLMVAQSDGYENVGYSRADLRNTLNVYEGKQVEVSDAEACLTYLRSKGQSDNGLFLRYSMDDRNRLVNLFWANSCARYDYAWFWRCSWI